MIKGTATFVHLSALLVGGTGLVYGWMRYFCEPADDFSLLNHPLQPDLKAWHIILAPALVFAVGVLWRGHIWGRIRAGKRERRYTGIALALLFFPMLLSGYLLQVAVDEGWRLCWIWVHAGSSVVWVLLYLVHQFLPERKPLPPKRS